jgi:hypothetical protein
VNDDGMISIAYGGRTITYGGRTITSDEGVALATTSIMLRRIVNRCPEPGCERCKHARLMRAAIQSRLLEMRLDGTLHAEAGP